MYHRCEDGKDICTEATNVIKKKSIANLIK